MTLVRTGRPRALVTGLSALLCVLAAGCASGGVASQSGNHWREDIGRVTRPTMEAGLEKIVQKHALQINRSEEGGRDLYYETVWMAREIMAAEEVRGVTNARNRIVLTGRQATMTGVYRFTWELQNEVTSVSAEGWHPDLVPAEVVDNFRPIYSDLVLEVRTGIR